MPPFVTKPVGRAALRQAMVENMRKDAQAERGTSIKEKSESIASQAHETPISERAGYPLTKTKVDPKDWQTGAGVKIEVDFCRAIWLPNDFGQGVKKTNPTARSKPGKGGTYTVYIGPEGKVYYHKPTVEEDLGRKLTPRDGIDGQIRLATLNGKNTNEEQFFQLLTTQERNNLPKKEDFHFAVISARRADTEEGMSDIAWTIANFKISGVEAKWYVDRDSVEKYRNLGVDAVVGGKDGKLCESRNQALNDAADLGKICVQVSDDIRNWEYHDGKLAKDKTDDAMNQAFAEATHHRVSPLAAARFMVAKMRSVDGERPRLGGIYPLGSCARTFASDPVCRKHFILGDFFVVDTPRESQLRFDQNMTLKEDYDFTCQHVFTHGSVFRLNRMTCSVKHETNAGGACTIRDKKGLKEIENMRILMEKWPRAIRPHTKRNFQVMMSWPEDGEAKRQDATPSATSRWLEAHPAKKESSTNQNRNTKKAVIKKIGKAKVLKGPQAKVIKKVIKKSNKTTTLKKATPKKEKVVAPSKAEAFSLTAQIARGTGTPSPYIKERCDQLVGKTVKQALTEFHYKNASGELKKYGMGDLRYDVKGNNIVLKDRR
eukprot:gnl/MRDRNA2_/MRDRNA2_93357_c0_seq1.p1 gnl/MRDRNA2_/MRDRNA2_93357_c0~~gnl/MRDRNA2_/MRDRNA2_93357_c0_seq1.p1  ORF type:complete len:602 (-),score=122.91 gnl/MRDRNA2_/MRDRNA2_93357_c0_seq1:111-1916(-)